MLVITFGLLFLQIVASKEDKILCPSNTPRKDNKPWTIRGKCLTEVQKPARYADAIVTCERYGGKLAKLQDFDRTLLSNNSKNAYWIKWTKKENGNTWGRKQHHNCIVITVSGKNLKRCRNNLLLPFVCSLDGGVISQSKKKFKEAKDICKKDYDKLKIIRPKTEEDWRRLGNYAEKTWKKPKRKTYFVWLSLLYKDQQPCDRHKNRDELVSEEDEEMTFNFKKNGKKLYSALEWNGQNYVISFKEESEKGYYICGTLPQESLMDEDETEKPNTPHDNYEDQPTVPSYYYVLPIFASILLLAIIIGALVVRQRLRRTDDLANSTQEREISPPFSIRAQGSNSELCTLGRQTSTGSYVIPNDIARLPIAEGRIYHIYESIKSRGTSEPATTSTIIPISGVLGRTSGVYETPIPTGFGYIAFTSDENQEQAPTSPNIRKWNPEQTGNQKKIVLTARQITDHDK